VSSTPTTLPLLKALADSAMVDHEIRIPVTEYLCNWREDINDFIDTDIFERYTAPLDTDEVA